MGVTYKAFDVDLRCSVTLKVISERYLGDESAQLRFLREARAAAKVHHSNVASVQHLGRTGSSYFYAMEFVEGETLEHLIRRSGRVEMKLALEIVAQVAAGLAAVHKQQLVHRDIKSSNIMVSASHNHFRLCFICLLRVRCDSVLQARVDAIAGRQCHDRQRRFTFFNKQSRRGDGRTRFVVVPDSIRARCLGVVHLEEMARQRPLGTSQAI
jgi:serine/threonine protein kinase